MTCGTCNKMSGLGAGNITFDPSKDSNYIGWGAVSQVSPSDMSILLSGLIYLAKDPAGQSQLSSSQKKAFGDAISNATDLMTSIYVFPNDFMKFTQNGGDPVPAQAITQWAKKLLMGPNAESSKKFAKKSWKRSPENAVEVFGIMTLLNYALKNGATVGFQDDQSARLGKFLLAGGYLAPFMEARYAGNPTVLSYYEILKNGLKDSQSYANVSDASPKPKTASSGNCQAELKKTFKKGKMVGFTLTNEQCGKLTFTTNPSTGWRFSGRQGNYVHSDALTCKDIDVAANLAKVTLNDQYTPFCNTNVAGSTGVKTPQKQKKINVDVNFGDESNLKLYLGLAGGGALLIGTLWLVFRDRSPV